MALQTRQRDTGKNADYVRQSTGSPDAGSICEAATSLLLLTNPFRPCRIRDGIFQEAKKVK